MTYSTDNAPALVAQRVGNNAALWIYKDGDDVDTVMANGYISNASELGITAGDRVIHVDETLGVTTDFTATSWTNGTASGATCSAIEPVGETSIVLASAGTGTILVGDIIKFGNDVDNEYRVTTGDTDVSDGGTIVITPALVKATLADTTIEVQSDVINLRGAGSRDLTEATTLLAAESGSTFFLNLAGGFTVTLPAPARGLKYKFVVKTAPTTAYIIATNGGADIMIGGVNELEVDTGDDGPYDANADVINLVASVAVVGDFIEMESDGTSWYFNGQTNADGGVTTATS